MTSPRIEWLDVARMAREQPPDVPWLVDGLVVRGNVTMLAGAPGEGKSLLVLALAAGIAAGESVAGIRCEQGRVVVLDAEQSSTETHRRVRGLGVPPGVMIATLDGFDLARHLDHVGRICADHQPDLLVLDSFRSLWHGDENDTARVAAVLDPLRGLAREHGTAIVLLHHVAKAGSGGYRGSTAIAASVELGFTLGRAEDDPDRRRRFIRCWKCRPAPEPGKRWVRIDDDRHLGLVFLEEAEPYQGAGGGDAAGRPPSVTAELRPRILSMLAERPMRRADVSRGLGKDPTDGTVRRIFKALEADGSIERRTDDVWAAKSCQTPPPLAASGTPPKSGSGMGVSGVPKGGAMTTAETPATAEQEALIERAITLVRPNGSGPACCRCEQPLHSLDADDEPVCAKCGHRP